MRRKLLAPAALLGVLLVASHAWAPPPPRPRPPVRPPSPPPRPPSLTPRPPAPTPPRPPVGAARPTFHKSFDAARARSASDAAHLLRTQGMFLAQSQRAAMLNLITLQMLRQRQSASLTELRRLRSDWQAVGPGAGLDPILAMELEATESAAERLCLAEVLKLVAAGEFAEAEKKMWDLRSPRYLPASVVRILADLHRQLVRAVPAQRMQKTLRDANPEVRDVLSHVATVTPEALPPAIRTSSEAWSALLGVSEMLAGTPPGRDRSGYSVADAERVLKRVKTGAGEAVAARLRPEMAAALLLDGRGADAAKLLEGECDPLHAAAVLADLRAAILGRGEITTPQVAALVPADAKSPPKQSAAVLPPDQLAKWKPPARKAGETTVSAAIVDARGKMKVAVDVEVADATGQVNASADRIRAALAAEAAPLKTFLEKVEAARGVPFASPEERQLAAVAATHGLTVAETIGILSAEADRPAVAARLAGAVAFANPGEFAARVEVAKRAPAAFKPHADGSFKLAGSRDRARVRDAVAATLNAHAAKVAAGQPVDPPARPELEAAVARQLGLSESLRPAECVQALLDLCRDWEEDHARLNSEARELSEIVAGIGTARRTDGAEGSEEYALLKSRRLSVQNDRKRREAAITAACQLLGDYGPAALPGAEWLAAQGPDKPWRPAATLNHARVTGK